MSEKLKGICQEDQHPVDIIFDWYLSTYVCEACSASRGMGNHCVFEKQTVELAKKLAQLASQKDNPSSTLPPQ